MTSLVPISRNDENNSPLEIIGNVANNLASNGILEEYRERRAEQTLRRQAADIALFTQFLAQAGLQVHSLVDDLSQWRGVTWGLVTAYVKWQLSQGYAIGSINVRLATIKTYSKLALKAGSISPQEFALIKQVSGYRHKEGINIDTQRETTRVGTKKAQATSITKEQARALKTQPDTSIGRRDALLMCLLLDHGLRCSEVADLLASNFNTEAGAFTFYRRKVDKTQTHKMTRDTLRTGIAYMAIKPDSEALLLGEHNGALSGPLSMRAINKRVTELGKRAGVEQFSPHDCRHYWATVATRNKADIKALQDAGGWNSPAMPLRYAESAAIANEGINVE